MSTYLLVFEKTIPIGDTTISRRVPWHTSINANGQVHAEQVAKQLGSMLRVRLPKRHDIALIEVLLVD